MKRNRNSIKYRVFHFINSITKRDFIKIGKFTASTVNEILALVALFVVLFILPMLFR